MRLQIYIARLARGILMLNGTRAYDDRIRREGFLWGVGESWDPLISSSAQLWLLPIFFCFYAIWKLLLASKFFHLYKIIKKVKKWRTDPWYSKKRPNPSWGTLILLKCLQMTAISSNNKQKSPQKIVTSNREGTSENTYFWFVSFSGILFYMMCNKKNKQTDTQISKLLTKLYESVTLTDIHGFGQRHAFVLEFQE